MKKTTWLHIFCVGSALLLGLILIKSALASGDNDRSRLNQLILEARQRENRRERVQLLDEAAILVNTARRSMPTTDFEQYALHLASLFGASDEPSKALIWFEELAKLEDDVNTWSQVFLLACETGRLDLKAKALAKLATLRSSEMRATDFDQFRVNSLRVEVAGQDPILPNPSIRALTFQISVASDSWTAVARGGNDGTPMMMAMRKNVRNYWMDINASKQLLLIAGEGGRRFRGTQVEDTTRQWTVQEFQTAPNYAALKEIVIADLTKHPPPAQ